MQAFDHADWILKTIELAVDDVHIHFHSRAELFDTSEKACELARRNLELNGVAERAEVRRADLYPELRRLKEAAARRGMNSWCSGASR